MSEVRESNWAELVSLSDLINSGDVILGRGNVISKIDIRNNPGPYPIYSSSAQNNGKMGEYGAFMFDEELISWSVDGGGYFFYRPKHKFSVTNVSGYMRLSENWHYRFIAYTLQFQHQALSFDYQTKAHPSVIRDLYHFPKVQVAEQQKIATILSSVDDVIEKTRAQIDKLKDLKTGMMQELLTQGIGHTEFKDSPVGRIPASWSVVTVGTLAQVIDPQPDHRTPPEVIDGIPYIGIGDVNNSGEINFQSARKVSPLVLQQQKNSFQIDEGAFMFGKIGTLGNPQKIPSKRFYCLSANIILVTTDDAVIMIYLFQVFKSGIIDSQIAEQTNTTSQPALGIKKLR